MPPVTSPTAPAPRRLSWRLATLVSATPETPRATSLVLDVPGWEGHRPGQHVDVRLTAEDGYQAQRSYSIASPPEQPAEAPRLILTVERLPDGEVSPYLVDVLRPGDQLELRGPIGGYFVWEATLGGPLLLVAGGSGIVPLMAMLRHRAATGSAALACLLYSSRSDEEIIYREELERLATSDGALRTCAHPHPHPAPRMDWLRPARRQGNAGRGGLAPGGAPPRLRLRAHGAG